MNIGEKINKLFEQSGYKTYADWGRAMDLPGDWLLDMKKKDNIEIGNIKRLIIFAEFNHITLEELLKNKRVVDKNELLPDNDIYSMLNQIQIELQNDDVKYNNYPMNKDCKNIAFDAIDVIKGLIRSNL